MNPKPGPAPKLKNPSRPFRRAIFRGLAILIPPLLTVVIFVWVGTTIEEYVLKPVTGLVREGIVGSIADVRHDLSPDEPGGRTATVDDQTFVRVDASDYIPEPVYQKVRKAQGKLSPQTAGDYYRRYVDLVYLRPYYVIPVFLVVFVLLLYLLGWFLAAGLGRAFWNLIELSINRVPLVRSVYSGIKQVVDFFFGEREVDFTRVVAVEFPRRGSWTVGFAVSEGLVELNTALGEPVVSVFIPTSPMPMGGYIINVPKREVIDMNLTVDQAIQFVVSCGVVVPPVEAQQQQVQRLTTEEAV